MTTVSVPPGQGGRPRDVSCFEEGAVTVVVPVGDVDIDAAPPIREALAAAFDARRPVVLDLSQVTFADSSALNLLLWANSSGAFCLAGPVQQQVQRLFDVTGVNGIFSTAATRAEALLLAARAAAPADEKRDASAIDSEGR
ncbi:STAS domain-containing protein [Streptomyces sp. SID10853]|uniref:STAS domain-containing protein n=1 Tax=Streptomyces sp. SID10853 TaxID=2706028 RepID=UPI0013C1148D|nr:STAS domain-containing protein [Streptomyces sp. SID10853]NDZ77957.1 STAS domain-containing protein [Streptomyces sp. SID10853]